MGHYGAIYLIRNGGDTKEDLHVHIHCINISPQAHTHTHTQADEHTHIGMLRASAAELASSVSVQRCLPDE